METDSFFYQLLKRLPETLFALLGQPLTRVGDYGFDAVEVKKSYRMDGLFVPRRADLPVYFVEVQFQRKRSFYANLFAKVFSYLMEEVLIRRFHGLDRLEIRRMFKLHDIRKTRVWQEAREEGIEIGIEEGRTLEKQQLVDRLRAGGQTPKEIAHLLGISLAQVRKLLARH